MEHEGDDDTNFNWCTWYSHQRLVKELGDLEMGGRVESIQTPPLVRSAGILRRVLEN